jgi:hypothetical protein
MLPSGSTNGTAIKIDEMPDELIRVLRFNAIGTKDFRGKVLEVEGHDYMHTADNGCGHYVTVIRIGQALNRWNEGLVPIYQRITHVVVHQRANPIDLLLCDVGAIGTKIPHPLLVYLLRPLSTEKPGQRQSHKEVTEWCRIEDVGIIEGGEARGMRHQ